MSWWEIVLLVIAAFFVVAFLGGMAANARHRRRQAPGFGAELRRVDRDLAAAHASDRGWSPALLDAAARAAFEAERPGEPVPELTLVQVIDPPGTDEDKAIFRLVTEAGEAHLTLGRRGETWVGEGIVS